MWGNATHAPDDSEGSDHTYGELISFRQIDPIPPGDEDVETPPFMHEQGQTVQSTTTEDPRHSKIPLSKNLTSDEAGFWILKHTPVTFRVDLVISFHSCDTHTERLRR